ncbi:MAG: BamA/TamA family outer membrane protein, partial [Pirellulales bacterium]|nr:BamA/TamA family outer membrane protein [Pirellulales bacterium]
TNLEAGGAVDPYAVEEGRRKIMEYYQGRGFNKVQVTILEGNKATDQGITYLINEGKLQKIWKVDFVGNEFVSDSRLETLIKSKPPKFLYFKGYVNREQIDNDVDQLTAYYRSFGYFQARISRKLEYNAKGNWVNLTFVIHEGERYKIRNARFMGNTIFEPTALANASKLKAGQPFEQTKVQQDALWLKELYGSHGYVFANIRPETVFLEKPGDVDLIYHIDEGEQFRVGRIIVKIDGDNPHTRIQTALNRMSIRPGQIVDTREIQASERRLQASQLFHSDPATGTRPKITYRISDESEIEFAERPPKRTAPQGSGSRGIRGQNPEPTGPLVLPPPPSQVPRQEIQTNKAIVRGQSPPEQTGGTAWWAQRAAQHRLAANRRTSHPYQNIRGQSPANSGTNPYAALPTGGTPSPYGGRTVGATGPASKPPASQPAIQQAQFTESIPPPAGSFGAIPGYPANTVPGYQLFPDGRFGLPGQPYPQQTVDIIFNGQETQTGRLMIGLGVNSDAGIIGNFVIDERNFDWRRYPTSFEDIRNGLAFRGDGQRFRLDASPGSEVNRYLVSFQEPYLFDTPLSLGLSGSFFDRRFRDWDEERLGGRVAIGWQWVERDVSANVSYRGENVTVTNAPGGLEIPGSPGDPLAMPPIPPTAPIPANPDLAEVLGSNSLHGFKVTVINDTRDSSFLPTQGRYLEMSGEYVTGSFDYPRVMVDYRRYFLLRERPDRSGRHVLSASTNVGWLGDDAPIYEHFFAGGFSTLRGFDFRGASPVDAVRGVEVGGHFQWLNSLQYLFPVTADEMLHGVVFCDFGTVERNVAINDFRVAPGVGLRVSVPAMGPAPIALDFAWAINEAATDDEEVFSFSMGFNR